MTFVSIEPPLAHESATTLTNSANSLESATGRLSGQWSALSASWQGSSKAAVESDVNSALGQIKRLAQRTRELGTELESIATRFEDADENVAFAVAAVSWGGIGLAAGAAISMMPAGVTVAGFFSWIHKKYNQLFNKKSPGQKTTGPLHDMTARSADKTFLAGQEKNDTCAMASLRMALKNGPGKTYDEKTLRELSEKISGGYRAGKGTGPASLAVLINKDLKDVAVAEYKGSQSIDNLAQAAKGHKGIVVSVNNQQWFGGPGGHAVTIVDVKTVNGKQMVYVNDPWPPNTGKKLAIPADDFKKAWRGDATYVSKVIPPPPAPRSNG